MRPAPRLLALFAGGAVGTALRALLDTALPLSSGHWPWATFTVNLAGAALLAVVLGVARRRRRTWETWRLALGTGVCGGLTTFSTLQVEALGLFRHGDLFLAISYLTATVAGGLAVVHLVLRLAARYRAAHP